MRWLLRMRLWAQRPKSETQVKILLGIVGICLALYAVERWIGWPEALTFEAYSPPNRVSR